MIDYFCLRISDIVRSSVRLCAVILCCTLLGAGAFGALAALSGCSMQPYPAADDRAAGDAAAGGGANGAAQDAGPPINSAIYSNDYIIDDGPVKGGSLRVYSTPPDTYNPLLTRNVYTQAMFSLVYEGLAGIDANLGAEPRLAESWAPSDDGLTWDIELCSGIKWHDGLALNAYDVIDTIERIRSYGELSPYAEMLSNIKSEAALSGSEIRLTLKKENAFTPNDLIFPVVPSHIAIEALDGESGAANLKSALIGTGPYRFDSYVNGRGVTLTASDKKSVAPPYIDSVSFQFYEPQDTALPQFRNRSVDLFFSRTFDYSRYRLSSEMRIRQYCEREFIFVALNCAKGITQAKSVRQAIARMVDRQKLIDSALGGRGIPAEFPVQPDNSLYGAITANLPFDPQAARSILENAGYRLDDGTFYGDAGNGWQKLGPTLIVNDSDTDRCALADGLADMLSEYGVQITVSREPADTVVQKVAAGAYDMALLSYRTSQYPDMTELYSYPWREGGAPMNPARYQNEYADVLSHELFTVYDGQDRQVVFSELAAVLQDDAPCVGICFRASSLVCSEVLRGRIRPNAWAPLNYFGDWYIVDYR